VGGGPLEGEDIAAFGEALMSAGSGLAARDPDEVVTSDLKIYDTAGKRFGIAQVELTALLRVSDHLEILAHALDRLSDKRALDFSLLMITDIVDGASRILMQGAPMVLEELPYKRLSDGTLDARGVVSRKKQLMPVVLALLEE
jgi:manganese-dependent inorganic pyrophosphatase